MNGFDDLLLSFDNNPGEWDEDQDKAVASPAFQSNGVANRIFFPEDTQPMFDIDHHLNNNMNCLVIGHNVNIKAIEELRSWSSLPNSLSIHLQRHHKDKFSKSRPGQSIAWPEMERGKNLLLIGVPKSGKTCSYLIPLISSSIVYRDNLNEEVVGLDSISCSIIICPTEDSVTAVYNLATSMIPQKKINVLKLVRPSDVVVGRIKKIIKEEGIDIFVTTPLALLKALDTNLIDLMTCVRLVFEDADIGFLVDLDNMKEIFLRYARIAQHKLKELRGKDAKTKDAFKLIKTVIVAEKLTDTVRQFYEEFQEKQTKNSLYGNSVVVIGDFFEAAVYARLEFRTFYSEDAVGHAENLLQAIDFSGMSRIVVCCEDKYEAKGIMYAIRRKYKEREMPVIIFDEDKDIRDHSNICSQWKANGGQMQRILVVTDPVLITAINQLNIKDAECIIHYSINKIKGLFSTRFNLMLKKLEKRGDQERGLSILLLSPDNVSQAHELVDLHNRLGIKVPDALVSLRNENPRGICRRFASMGICPLEKYFCFFDHFIPEGAPNLLPSFCPATGQIKFQVTRIISVTEYYVRVEAHRSSLNIDWKKTLVIEDFQKELDDLRDSSPSLRCSQDIKVGDYFAIMFSSGEVRRVKVTDIEDVSKVEHYEDKRRKKYTVFHLDFGMITKVDKHALLDLPQDLQKYPPLAIKVFVTGLKPTENMYHWSIQDNLFIEKLFKGSGDMDHMTAWIYFASGDNLWLDGVKLHYYLKHLRVSEDRACISLTRKLTEGDTVHAVSAPKLPYFNKSFDVEEVKMSQLMDDQKEFSRSSFLETHPDVFNEVYLVYLKSLQDFYVRHFKFQKCLEQLEKDIFKSDLKPLPASHFKVGMLCLQKYSEDSVNRAKIMRINSQSNTVDVFYVDHGETWTVDRDSLFQLDMKFLKRHPFLAIHCKLADYEGKVSDNDVYDATRDEGDCFKVLLCKKLSSENAISKVVIYIKKSEEEEQFVYYNLGRVLLEAGQEVVKTNFEVMDMMKMKKPVFINPEDDYDTDEYSPPVEVIHTMSKEEKEAYEKMMKGINTGIENTLKFVEGPSSGPGHVARRNISDPVKENGEVDENEDSKEQIPGLIRPKPRNYEPGQFTDCNGLPVHPYDPDDDDDESGAESDDNLDLECPGDGGHETNFEFAD